MKRKMTRNAKGLETPNDLKHQMLMLMLMLIYDSKQKHQELHTSERTIVPRTVIFSSEGALYVILPYDYPQQRTHFLNTHRSIRTTWSINAMMTLVTVITMMTKTTKMTISDDNF